MINIRCQNLGVRLYWSVVRQHLTEGGLSPTRMKFKVKTSRSELYSRAIAEFVARHDDDAVTQALDEVARNINADPSDTQITTASAFAILRQVEW